MLGQFAFLLLFLTSGSLAAVYTSPSQLPKTTYDYIVIGAGAAGAVVANRLTENPAISVLLLEAGISNENVTASIVPLLGPSLTPDTIYDYNYSTTAQTGLNGRSIAYPRGRMLGGSTSVNFMTWTYGSSDDYDRYSKIAEDLTWSWDNMKKYILKVEKFVPPVDGHNTTGEFNPSVHGTNGSVLITLPGFPTPLDHRVLDTTQELADEFPFLLDMNSGDILGVGWSMVNDGKGSRSSSATAFLSPEFTSRQNFDVLIHAQVTKLLQTGTVGGLPSFHSVQFAANSSAPTSTVHATKEIVLSAGSIGTPVILQLSGIGDKNALGPLGIKSLVHNPSVGANLTDHVLLSNVYSVQGNQSFDNIFRSTALLDADLAQWSANKTGPLTDTVANQLGWLRLPANSSIFGTISDPSAGPKAAHWEIIFSNEFVMPGGSVKITTSDPFSAPEINPRFLATDFDIFTIIEAVKAAKRFMSASAWEDYIIGPYGEYASANTDAEIEVYARNTAGSVWHPVATASMSPTGAAWGVVDPDLKVKGVEGLRIVDGSILPFTPSAHTTAPIYLVAEHGADLIKSDIHI